VFADDNDIKTINDVFYVIGLDSSEVSDNSLFQQNQT